jgi:hypothetical protein
MKFENQKNNLTINLSIILIPNIMTIVSIALGPSF